MVVVPDRSFILGVEVKRDPRNNSSFNNGAQLKTVWREREREREKEREPLQKTQSNLCSHMCEKGVVN